MQTLNFFCWALWSRESTDGSSAGLEVAGIAIAAFLGAGGRERQRETDDSSSQVVVPLLCVRNFVPLCSSFLIPLCRGTGRTIISQAVMLHC